MILESGSLLRMEISIGKDAFGAHGKKMGCLLTCVHCLARIARTSKHLAARPARNAGIGSFFKAIPARCTWAAGAAREEPRSRSCVASRRASNNYPHLPSPLSLPSLHSPTLTGGGGIDPRGEGNHRPPSPTSAASPTTLRQWQ
jgi:hypothetical protein